MFDDLKQNNSSSVSSQGDTTPTNQVSSPTPASQTGSATAVSQGEHINDMFGDVDPTPVHGPVDPNKPSAVQSGKMKVVSQTSIPPAQPNNITSPTQVPVSDSTVNKAPISPVLQNMSNTNVPPSDSMIVTDDRTSGFGRKIIIAVLVIFLLAIVGGGVYYLFLRNDTVQIDVANNQNVNTNIIVNQNVNKNINQNIDKPVIDEDDLDDDFDGLSNGLEKVYGTNPLEPDTDNDGVFDQDEIEVYKTDPLVDDSDNDGLSDYEEIIIYNTDPNDPDTDGDTYQDGVEVSNGYNPLGNGRLSEDNTTKGDGLLNTNENL